MIISCRAISIYQYEIFEQVWSSTFGFICCLQTGTTLKENFPVDHTVLKYSENLSTHSDSLIIVRLLFTILCNFNIFNTQCQLPSNVLQMYFNFFYIYFCPNIWWEEVISSVSRLEKKSQSKFGLNINPDCPFCYITSAANVGTKFQLSHIFNQNSVWFVREGYQVCCIVQMYYI